MTEFQSLQGIALERYFSGEIHFMERFHRDLTVALVCLSIGRIMEGKVVFDSPLGQFRFFVDTVSDRGYDSPEAHEDGNGGQRCKEQEGPFSAADLGFEVIWDDREKEEQQTVIERSGAASFCWERRIGDGGRRRCRDTVGGIGGFGRVRWRRLLEREGRHGGREWRCEEKFGGHVLSL